MENNEAQKKQKYVYILIGIAVFLLIHSIYKKKRFEAALSEKLIESAKIKLDNQTPLSPSERAKIDEFPQEFAQHQKQIQKGKEKSIAPPPQRILSIKSQKTIQSFKAETHLEFDVPKSFQFVPLDLDTGFAGFYGEDFAQKAKITGLAYQGHATAEQAFKFLRTDADMFPNLATNPIIGFNSRESLPKLPENSGFGDGTLWTGKLKNGEAVAAVFMQRSDQKGSYMFVVTGPEAYFEKNDGAFNSIYDKAKALTPKLP